MYWMDWAARKDIIVYSKEMLVIVPACTFLIWATRWGV